MLMKSAPMKFDLLSRSTAANVALATTIVAAHADILNYDASKVRVVAKPVNQRYVANAYNRPIVGIWNEQTNVVLPANLPVDIGGNGTFAGFNELGNYWVKAGTRVDSQYLYFDPSMTEAVETTVTFTGRILGVIMESDRMGMDRLLFSDTLALPSVPRKNFPRGHFNARGLELPPARNITLKGRGHDWVAVQGNAITIHVRANNPGDQIRVITESSH